MKSIKPGRGPSGMNFIGSLFAIGFGIVWIVLASSMFKPVDEFSSLGLPGFGSEMGAFDTFGTIFPLFGLLFIAIGIVNAIYSYKNATGKNRFSIVDIVDEKEEGDAAAGWVHKETAEEEAPAVPNATQTTPRYCTNCGHALEKGYAFCPGCGKPVQ